MKKILLLLLCTSCIKYEVDFVHTYMFNIQPIPDYSFDIEEMVYDWDESILGRIGYTEQSFYESIYQDDAYYLSKSCDSVIDVYTNKKIDVVVSNLQLEDTKVIKSDTLNIETPPFIKSYPFYSQPDEIFIGSKTFISNIDLYKWKIIEDVKQTTFDTSVKPVSCIYMVQIIIDNPDVVCDSLIVSGVCCSVNLTEKLDIKGNLLVPLQEKQIHDNNSVYAARVLTFGLVPFIQGSWEIPDESKVFIWFKVTNDRFVKHVKVDVTRKMIKPYGLITIKIAYSELTGGMDLFIDDWNVQEFEINL